LDVTCNFGVYFQENVLNIQMCTQWKHANFTEIDTTKTKKIVTLLKVLGSS